MEKARALPKATVTDFRKAWEAWTKKYPDTWGQPSPAGHPTSKFVNDFNAKNGTTFDPSVLPGKGLRPKPAGTATTPTTSKAPTTATATIAELQAKYHGLKPFLDIPELVPGVRKLISGEWTQADFDLWVQGTSWYNKTTLDKQKWLTLPQAEKDQLIATQAVALVDYYTGLYGLDYMRTHFPQKLDPKSAENRATAEKIASGVLSETVWKFQALSSALKVPDSLSSIAAKEQESAGRRLARQPREIADRLYTTARHDYWVPITKDQALVWAKKINDGTVPEADFMDYLRKQAGALYPLVQKQIENGVEPGVLFAPYTNIAADELGIAPDAVIMNDRLFSGFFQHAAMNGQFPSDQEFRHRIRNLDEWRFGEKANKVAADGALSILSTFGKVVR